jgi:sorting nexin-9/18/33
LYVPDSARRSLTEAVRVTGDTYHEIGKLFEEQPKLDWEPLGDVLHLYKGIISSFPDILTVHKVSKIYYFVTVAYLLLTM